MTTNALGLLSLLALLATPTAAAAAVLQVANNGLDGAACGTKTAPCRSITRAIDNAAPGDTLVVGPGRYGDLDRDGTTGEANEEGPEVGALILIDKTLTLESSGGAAVTVIDVAGFGRKAIRITASGVRVGRPKKGFTFFDSSTAGVSIEDPAANVIVEGNLAIDTLSGFLTAGSGGGHLLQGNVAVANALGVGLASAGGGTARSNLAVVNTTDGFQAGGTGSQRFEGNVALGNFFGLSAQLYDEATFVGNVAVGNRQGVFAGNGDTLTVSGLAAIANVEGGVHNQGTTTMSVAASNLIGNGAKALGGSLNCGTLNESDPLAATNVFWGAASGPGDDPADDVCDLLSGVTTVAPFATKPFKVKTKVPQL
jgi:hypothetical protein